MRFKISLTLALFMLCAVAAVPARAQTQQNDQKIIDDFVGTRGVSFESASKPKQAQKPAAQPSQAGGRKSGAAPSKQVAKGGGAKKNTGPATTAAKKQGGAVKGDGPNVTTGGATSGEVVAANTAEMSAGGAGTGGAQTLLVSDTSKPIGLGYTLYFKQGENLVVTDTTREFRENDEIRITLETNTDAYVYIFNTTDGINPMMLYPNVLLDNGANIVRAHTRDFIPADTRAGYVFDAKPGLEQVHIVVSRRPLEGVPTGDALFQYCGGVRRDCYWQPAPEQWEQIKKGIRPGGVRVLEGRNTQLAQQQQPLPASTLTRGIKVKVGEPPPAVVRVNESPTADVLVTTIDLIHK